MLRVCNGASVQARCHETPAAPDSGVRLLRVGGRAGGQAAALLHGAMRRLLADLAAEKPVIRLTNGASWPARPDESVRSREAIPTDPQNPRIHEGHTALCLRPGLAREIVQVKVVIGTPEMGCKR